MEMLQIQKWNFSKYILTVSIVGLCQRQKKDLLILYREKRLILFICELS